MIRYFTFSAALAFFFLAPHAAQAGTGCTLVVDYKSSAILHEDGDCKTRYGAQSTFKIPLALMGFDSGILKDAHTPAWPYDEGVTVNRPEDKFETDPTRWEKESVVWFSQKITTQLGAEKFKNYVEAFNYGNKDISGDAGKKNGLTNAWLSSSLKIAPIEQVAFIGKMLDRKFKIAPEAYDHTLLIIPEFKAGDWTVHGKTGTGFAHKDNGKINRDAQQGWFVGWAENGGRKILFAKFIADDKKEKTYAGPRARDALLKDLPTIMAYDRHNEH
jgi:beta-lactamase class D